jgi:hypothetical protein
MRPAELLGRLTALHERLDGEPVSFSSQVESKVLGNILDIYLIRIQYENAKRQSAIRPVELLESYEPLLTDDEKQMLITASALHWKIVEHFTHQTPKSRRPSGAASAESSRPSKGH